MLYSLLSWFFILAIIGNQILLVEGSFKVTITDPNMMFSPRLHAASSVVYNNALYTYGGKTGSRTQNSNKMYRFALSEDSTQVSLSSVNQINGPNCSYCGAVMINANKMMILTNSNTSSDEVVRPYTFDFLTNEWSSDINLPLYNESLKDVFRLRQGHNTVVSRDGSKIYTIGGNMYSSSQTLNTAWYFDIQSNSYNLVDGVSPRNVSYGNAVTLWDGNIGVVYGTADKNNLTYYASNSLMNVIDVENNRWEEGFRQLGGEIPKQQAYGVSSAISPDSKFAYFMGGYVDTGATSYILRGVSVLDLTSLHWIKVSATYELGSVVAYRYFSVAAILNENSFINVLGTSNENYPEEKHSVDIFELPPDLENNDQANPIIESGSETIQIAWKSAVQPTLNDGIPRDAKQSFYIILIVSILFILVISIMVIKAARISKDRTKNQRFTQLSWGQKIADLVIVRNSSFLTALILLGILSLCVAYLAINVIQSPISTSDYDSVPLQSIALPDIRVCYSGWKGNPTPRLQCRYVIDSVDGSSVDCSKFIESLTSSIHTPTLAERSGPNPACYMLIASKNATLYSFQPKIQLYHQGRSFSDSEAVFVEFYEPSKNPNRRLFGIKGGPNMTAAEMDKWLDDETYYGKETGTALKAFMAYPDSKISVQFETTYTLKLNPTAWNHIGVLPSRSNESTLSITHSDVIARDRGANRNITDVFLGSLTISPSEFAVTSSAETFDNSVVSAIGSFGGIISIATGLYIFLFGYTPGEPWGWVQKVAVPRKRKMQKLATYFDIQEASNIPFVSPVHPRFAEVFRRNLQTKNRSEAKMDKETGASEAIPAVNNDIPFVSSARHRLAQLFKRKFGRSGYSETKMDEEAGVNEAVLVADNAIVQSDEKMDSIPLETERETEEVLDSPDSPRKRELSGSTIADERTQHDIIMELSERVSQMEARNQMLELVLKAYYINDDIFNELKTARDTVVNDL